MRIQHNIMAMSAYRNYTNNVSAMKKNLEKLSSGYKINRAGDDAAGLAISEKMRAQITGLETAQKNAKDGISLVQTAEGALTEVHDMLNRMVELATMSANGTYDNTTDRAQLQKELNQLRDEIDRIADSSNFNGIQLLDGSMAGVGTVGGTEEKFELGAGGAFGLPDVGGSLGFDTVLHKDKDNLSGTSFEVAFHNVGDNPYAHNVKGGEFKVTVGDIAISLKGVADYNASGASTKNLDDVLKAIVGGSAAAASQGFELSVEIGGQAADVQVNGDGITIEHDQYGLINITRAGDNLKFQQVQVPDGTKVQQWNAEQSVNVEFKNDDKIPTKPVPNGGTTRIMTLSASPASAGAGTTTVTITGGSVSISGSASTAVTGDVTFDDAALKAALASNAPASTASISLKFDSAGSAWTIKVGAASVSAVGSLSGSGVLTLKATASATAALMTMVVTKGSAAAASAATIGAIQNAFGTAKGVGAYTVTQSGGGSSVSSNTSVSFDAPTLGSAAASTAKAAIAAATTADAAIAAAKTAFGSSAVAKKETTLSASIGSTVAAIFDGSAATVKASAITGTLTIASIGASGISVDLATIAAGLGSTVSVEDFANAVVAALQKEANAVAGSAIAAGATSVTLYTNFRIVGADGNQISRAGGAAHVEYDVVRVAPESKLPADIRGIEYDYNVSTVKQDTVYVNEDARLGSTYLNADALKDKINDGAELRLGNTTYVFTTATNVTDTATRVNVNIKDLMKNDQWVDDAAFDKAMNRLTKAAGSNSLYTVGYDGQKITLTEQVESDRKTGVTVSGNLKYSNGEKIDLTTEAGIAKSIGFTASKRNEVIGEDDVRYATQGKGLKLQIGDTADDFNQLTVFIDDMHVNALGIGSADMNIDTQEGAKAAIDVIKAAINKVSDLRGTLGATQNRLDHTINNLSVMTENIQDAESTIRDTDVAEEMMAYTKNNILIQSAQAMLAQANQVPQGVLQLLQ